MWRRIWHRLFSRKWELLILGAIVIICALAAKYVAIDHWNSIGWDLSSYSPWAPIIGIIWMTAYTLVLYLRKVHAPSLWIMGIAGWIYSFIMLWAIWLNK